MAKSKISFLKKRIRIVADRKFIKDIPYKRQLLRTKTRQHRHYSGESD